MNFVHHLVLSTPVIFTRPHHLQVPLYLNNSLTTIHNPLTAVLELVPHLGYGHAAVRSDWYHVLRSWPLLLISIEGCVNQTLTTARSGQDCALMLLTFSKPPPPGRRYTCANNAWATPTAHLGCDHCRGSQRKGMPSGGYRVVWPRTSDSQQHHVHDRPLSCNCVRLVVGL